MRKAIFACHLDEDRNRVSPVLETLLAAFFIIIMVAACARPRPPKPEQVPFPEIRADDLLQHVRILSSDEYEGRAPGTKGEDLTVSYLVDQFKKAGLRPGNTDGTYVQKVPMVGITVNPGADLLIDKETKHLTLTFKDDFVPWTRRVLEKVMVDKAPFVFVGYGIQAPEYSWDDYKGVNMEGKIMVVLIGDPPIPDPNDPSKLDPNIFGGKAMTYYGRWTYKCEMAAKMGAAGVLIVHETEPAAYPFSVVQTSWIKEQLCLIPPDKNMSRAALEAWITLDGARRLFRIAGMSFDTLKKKALDRTFTPVLMNATGSARLNNTIRTVDSRNVIGVLEGSDPDLKNEYIIYTAHWDHLGIGPEVKGDRIYHGAVDNATGVGGLIEIARAYARVSILPRRSILFMSVTAEEQGLLGSEYYTTNPIYPLAKTVAVINMDALNVYGKTKDVTIIRPGMSDLDDIAAEVAEEQGRMIKPDPAPEKGSYFRSDHFPFAKAGVPALASESGIDHVGKPADFGQKLLEKYTAESYHQPADVIKADWDLSGAIQDLQYYWMVGYRAARANQPPRWKPGSEFGTTAAQPRSPAGE
jgi:Zn-dependent M28 family amino/carboxypeptidase